MLVLANKVVCRDHGAGKGESKKGRRTRGGKGRKGRGVPAGCAVLARAAPQEKVCAHWKVVDKRLFKDFRKGQRGNDINRNKNLVQANQGVAPLNVEGAVQREKDWAEPNITEVLDIGVVGMNPALHGRYAEPIAVVVGAEA